MDLTRLTLNELMLTAAGTAGFAAKVMPMRTPQGPADVGLICFSDQQRAFLLFNQMLRMSRFDTTSGEFSEDVFETVCLSAPAQLYETLPLGGMSQFKLEWSGGPTIWRPAVLEQLSHAGQPLQATLTEVVISTAIFEGRAVEFLLGLRLGTAKGEWMVSRSTASPDFFSVVECPAEGFWSAWR
jgi:hypothetical protein